MFLEGLDLEMFYHTDISETLEQLDIEEPLHTYSKKLVTFYSINALTVYLDEKDNNKEYCRVFTGSDTFISPLTRKELKKIVDKHLKTTANMLN